MNSFRLIESVWMLAIIAVLVAIVYALTGCASTTTVKPVIDLQRPVLPEIKSSELECVSWETYARLRERDLALHQWADELHMTLCEVVECPR